MNLHQAPGSCPGPYLGVPSHGDVPTYYLEVDLRWSMTASEDRMQIAEDVLVEVNPMTFERVLTFLNNRDAGNSMDGLNGRIAFGDWSGGALPPNPAGRWVKFELSFPEGRASGGVRPSEGRFAA